jgi:hypothetical protein
MPTSQKAAPGSQASTVLSSQSDSIRSADDFTPSEQEDIEDASSPSFYTPTYKTKPAKRHGSRKPLPFVQTLLGQSKNAETSQGSSDIRTRSPFLVFFFVT